MEHTGILENISPAEKTFKELMTNGDDFMKIEIYRSALSRYKEAAKLNIDNALASQKVAECERLLKNERKWIYVVLGAAAVAVILIVIF
jgi:hypothetical protein